MEDPSRRTVLAALASAGAVAGAGCQSLPQFDAARGCPDRRESRWEISGRAWSPPARGDHRTVVSEGFTATGGGPYRIASIRDHDGQEQWVYNVANAGGGVPSITGESVYVGTGEDRVLAFDDVTGHVEWAYDAGGSEEYGGGAWGRPAVVDDLVVVGVSHSDRRNADPSDPGDYRHRIVAVDRADGGERWAEAVDRMVRGGPAVAGDVVVAASKGGTVYGLALDGTRLWERSVAEEIWLRPLADGNEAYVAAMDGTVAALAVDSGEVRWSETPGSTCSAFVDDEASLLVGTVDGAVVAYARDGRERWRYDAGAHVADIASTSAKVWVFDQCGVVHRLNASDGQQEDRFRIGECVDGETCNRPPWAGTGIAVDGDSIYLTGEAVGRYPAFED